jgi:hypothetical protein
VQLLLGIAPPVLSWETAKRSSLPHWNRYAVRTSLCMGGSSFRVCRGAAILRLPARRNPGPPECYEHERVRIYWEVLLV